MYLNDFSVRIPEGNEVSGGYVEMRHGQQYTLVLRNNHNVHCDAKVEIDGSHVGTWRIQGNSNIMLERPVHDTGRFTFYKLGTPEATQAQLNSGSPDLGLVKVTFMPERERVCGQESIVTGRGVDSSKWIPGAASTMSFAGTRSAGGTGLSGDSGQRFHEVGPLTYDFAKQTTIHLRLVCKEPSSGGARPLTSTSNPIPPRVW